MKILTNLNPVYTLNRITHYSEGLTSLIAGSYILSLALTKRNVGLRLALGVAGGYLILRSGSKLSYGKAVKELG